MKKLVMLFVVILTVLLLVGCQEEETPTPIEVDLDIQEIMDVLDLQEYELVIVQERREVTGGYEYGVKLSNQSVYDYNNNVWYFSNDYIKTGFFGILIHIDETNYVLVAPTE